MILVQFGDLHLDMPYENLSAAAARYRREADRKLLCAVCELAKRENADAIVCTGDLFDSPRPYLDSCLCAAKVFSQIDIPVFLAPGNHDPFSPSSPYEAVDWPKNVRIFSSAAPISFTFPNFRITGWANTEHRSYLRPLENFRAEKISGKPEILVFHGEIGSDSPYFSADSAQIAASGADYLALGHIHAHFQKRIGSCLAVMNGGVQACRRGETGEKGAIVANITSEGSSAKLVSLGGCRAFDIELEDRGEEELSAMLSRLITAPKENAMVTLTLSGEPLTDSTWLKAFSKGFLSFKTEDRRKKKTATRSGKSLSALFARAAINSGLSELATEFGLCALENREQPSKKDF